MENFQRQLIDNDIATVERIGGVKNILKVLQQITEMRITLISRITDNSWTACAVLDEADFGLKSGDQLDLTTTY